MERDARVLRDLGPDSRGGAHGHGALRDHDLRLIHVLADDSRHGEDVLEVRRAVLVRGRADRDDDHVGALHGPAHFGGELEPSLALVPHDERLEAGLVDRQPVLLEPGDLRAIHIGAQDVVAGLGEAGTYDEPDIPRPDDGDLHRRLCTRASALRVSTTRRACWAMSS